MNKLLSFAILASLFLPLRPSYARDHNGPLLIATAACVGVITIMGGYWYGKSSVKTDIIRADEQLIQETNSLKEHALQRYTRELDCVEKESLQGNILPLASIIHSDQSLEKYFDKLTFTITQLKSNLSQLQLRLAAWQSPNNSFLYYLLQQGRPCAEEVTNLATRLEKLREIVMGNYQIIYLYEIMAHAYNSKYAKEIQIYTDYQRTYLSQQEYINQLHALILTRISDTRSPYPYIAYVESLSYDFKLLQGALQSCSRNQALVSSYHSLYDEAQTILVVLQAIHEYIATSQKYQEERTHHAHAQELHKIAEAESRKAKAKEDEVLEVKKQTDIQREQAENLRRQIEVEAEKLAYEQRFQPTRLRLEKEIEDLTRANREYNRDKTTLENDINGLRGDIYRLKHDYQRATMEKTGIEKEYLELWRAKEALIETLYRHANQLESLLLVPPYNPASLPDEWPEYFEKLRHAIQYLKQDLAHHN
jgi:hypothetical protein